jgi:UbiD family decarboxylase
MPHGARLPHDGGPYIGTACLVAMKDPDSGWINYGTYRVQSHEPKVASVMMSPGKHGLIIMRKDHERGQPCPVAVVAGMHPALVMLGGIEIPYGKNELEAAGGILGEPIEVINMRGNAMSGAPIISGTIQLPKPPISAGITMKKIMMRPCAVVKTS